MPNQDNNPDGRDSDDSGRAPGSEEKGGEQQRVREAGQSGPSGSGEGDAGSAEQYSRGGPQFGQQGYGEASGSGSYGEGGFQTQSGPGGYGSGGYGADHHQTRQDRHSNMGPTYSDDPNELRPAQRSNLREDQRYGDHGSTGETWRADRPQRENEYGAVDRQQQDGWRTRNDDHDHNQEGWNPAAPSQSGSDSMQTAGSPAGDARASGAAPTETATDQPQSVTDGDARPHDKGGDAGKP
jgi:hypothetical protein